jgi:hypothetical protein
MKFHFSEWRLAMDIAWDDPWFKIQTVATIGIVIAGSFFYLLKLIPSGIHNGSLVFHYNVYLGIDDVRRWPWVFYLPSMTIGIVCADLVASFLTYRYDKIASRVLLSVATLFAVLTAVGEIFIVIMNG